VGNSPQREEHLKGDGMKLSNVGIVFLTLALTAGTAVAIDRNASMIDAVRIEGASYDHADYGGINITGETRVDDTGGQWAIVAGVSAGSLSLDAGSDFDALALTLGAKYYFTQLTSLAILGNYTWYDASGDFEVGTATASVKHRLLPATEPISPFIRIDTSIQFVDQLNSYDVLVLVATAGCDFMMTDSMAIVFEGGISESEGLDDNGFDRADGWLASVAMQYYWE
jgi:hypothetical protein